MRLVVDANIIFSLLIRGDASFDLFFSDELQLMAPSFLVEEFEKHQTYLLNASHHSEEEFLLLLKAIKRRIHFAPLEEYSPQLSRARVISPDENDTAYVALALSRACPIWSEDKALKEKQSIVEVFSTRELWKKVNEQI